jgi:hypothetical protein
MKIVFLAFLMTALICAYPSENTSAEEDWFSASHDPRIFDGDTLVSSLDSPNHETKEPSTSNVFDIGGSVDSMAFLAEDFSMQDFNFDILDPSIASIREKPSENLFY